MKQKLFILGVVILAAKEHLSGVSEKMAISAVKELAKKGHEAWPKKRIIRLPNGEGLGDIVKNLGKYIKSRIISALKPVSSNAFHSEFNDDSEDKQSDLFPSTDHPENDLQHSLQLNKNFHKNFSGKSSEPFGHILSIESVRPSFIPYSGGVAEVSMDSLSIPEQKTDLEKGFYKYFEKDSKSVGDPKKFVKKGILNAKKNLLAQTRLARAYASAAAQKTIDAFENTLRSSHLLSDLVKKGLVTPYSAAKELAISVKDVASEFIDASSRNMKGASNYLLGTAVESVDGIVNGLKYSPSAISSLLKSYETILTNPKFNFYSELPFLATSLEMDVQRLKDFLHPHSIKPMGSILESLVDTMDLLKKQWSKLGSSFIDKNSELYKEKFFSVTENLAKTLDALRARLGKGARLQVPGIDALKFRFKSILDELKKKNNLTISGNVSFKELLDYSMGIFTQLKDIDKAILGLVPSMEGSFSGMHLSNPIGFSPGFNKSAKDALKDIKAFIGNRGVSIDPTCIRNCLG